MVNAPPAPPYVTDPSVVGGNSPGENTLRGADRPTPGELKIKERRSWRTWQLLVFGVACLLLGLLISYSDSGKQTKSTSSTGGNYKLPPEQGTATPTPASSATTQAPATSASTAPPPTAAVTP